MHTSSNISIILCIHMIAVCLHRKAGRSSYEQVAKSTASGNEEQLRDSTRDPTSGTQVNSGASTQHITYNGHYTITQCDVLHNEYRV